MADNNFKGTMLLLQNRTKRDPESYKDEFKAQLAHFDAHSRAMSGSTMSHSNPQYLAVLSYVCHVSHCFPKECAHVPGVIIDILKSGKGSLDPETRIAMVKNLILLRSKNVVQPEQTLPVLFELLQVRDKAMRKLILGHVVSDIKRVNLPGAKNGKAVNKKVQNFLFGIMKEDDAVQAYSAMQVVIDLFRRQIWVDERAVEVLCQACFSRHSKILRVALRFLMMQMPKVTAMESDSEEDVNDPGRVISKMKQKLKIKAKTRKRERVLKRDKNKLIRKYDQELKEEKAQAKQHVDPIQFIRDPQTFCEKLFGKMQKTSERFETRILYLTVLSRVIFEYDVIVLPLYPYLERYMEPTQLHSTQLLALASSCVHKMIPPDVIEPLIRTIANHFVNDRSNPDQITIGINTIREMCKRCPLAMTKPLLADLAEYKQHRGQRGVIMAARALIQMYRELAPDMLPAKLRGGRNGISTANSKDIRYGAAAPLADIPGMELLMEHLGEAPPNPDDLGSDSSVGDISDVESDGDADDDQNVDDDSNASSSSGSWVDVEHSDDEDEDLLDSDFDDIDTDDEALSDEDENNDVVAADEEDEDDSDVEEGSWTGDDEDDSEEDDDDVAPNLINADGARASGRASGGSVIIDGAEHRRYMPDDDSDVWLSDDESVPEQPAKRARDGKSDKKASALPTKKKRQEVQSEESDEDEEDDLSSLDSDALRMLEEMEEDDEEDLSGSDDEEADDEEGSEDTSAANSEDEAAWAQWEEASDDDDEEEEIAEEDDESDDEEDELEEESEDEDEEEEEETAKGSSKKPPTPEGFIEDIGGTNSEVGSTAPSLAARSTASGASTHLSSVRILTDADFAKLRQLQAMKENGTHQSLRGKQKSEKERLSKREQLIHGVSANLSSEMIETFTNRKRTRDKEEKIEKAIETRAAKTPFNIRKKTKSKLFSTNTEKAKRGKLFQMTKRSGRVAEKIKRSTVERGDRKKDMKKKDIKFRIKRGWKA